MAWCGWIAVDIVVAGWTIDADEGCLSGVLATVTFYTDGTRVSIVVMCARRTWRAGDALLWGVVAS